MIKNRMFIVRSIGPSVHRSTRPSVNSSIPSQNEPSRSKHLVQITIPINVVDKLVSLIYNKGPAPKSIDIITLLLYMLRTIKTAQPQKLISNLHEYRNSSVNHRWLCVLKYPIFDNKIYIILIPIRSVVQCKWVTCDPVSLSKRYA